MALWNVDLTTEDGALGAAQMGSLACLISAVVAGFYLLAFLGVTSGNAPPEQAAIGGAVVWFFAFEVLIFAVAAFLLRTGKGVIPGIIAGILLALEVLLRLAGLALIPLIFDTLLLIFTINGVRGARALGKGIVNDEEAAEIFR